MRSRTGTAVPGKRDFSGQEGLRGGEEGRKAQLGSGSLVGSGPPESAWDGQRASSGRSLHADSCSVDKRVKKADSLRTKLLDYFDLE